MLSIPFRESQIIDDTVFYRVKIKKLSIPFRESPIVPDASSLPQIEHSFNSL